MENTEILKFKDGDLELDVIYSPNENTAWLSTRQIAMIFNKERSSISKYIKSIKENYGNFAHLSVNFAHLSVNSEHVLSIGKRENFYNLDIILEIGNRLKSKKGLMLKTFIDKHRKNAKNVETTNKTSYMMTEHVNMK